MVTCVLAGVTEIVEMCKNGRSSFAARDEMGLSGGFRVIAWLLEAACSAGGVVEHEADEGLAVVDFVGGDEGEGFGEGEQEDFDVLVVFGLGCAFADVAGEVDLHPFAEEAGAGEVFGEEGPAFGAVAGLFDHLALGGGEGGFSGFDAAGGKLEEELAGGVAVLALEDDVGVVGVRLDSSTARMTTEPLWRMTSRTLMWPPGSCTVSVKTEKTLPL